MNKVALITDFHFGCKKNNDIFLANQIKFFTDQFMPYLKDNGINTICILGDIFDNRNSIHTKVLNDVINLFDDMKFLKKIYIIVGNHDSYLNSSIEINSIKFLNKFENIEIIDQPKTIEIYGKKTLFVPWITDNDKFGEYFKNQKFDVCLGHFDITGFNFNKFKTSQEGLSSDMFWEKQTLIFSGHFHTKSKQKRDKSEIVYIGSPYQMTRNDCDEERGFTILDMDDMSYENINNKISMKYIKINYPEKFSEATIKGNIIDVYINYKDIDNDKKIEQYINQIDSCEPVYKPNIFVINNEEIENEFDFDQYKVGSIMDLMKDYIDAIDIQNKNDIYNILVDLYNNTKGEII